MLQLGRDVSPCSQRDAGTGEYSRGRHGRYGAGGLTRASHDNTCRPEVKCRIPPFACNILPYSIMPLSFTWLRGGHRSASVRMTICGRRESRMALEVSRKEEGVVIADLSGNFFNAFRAFQKFPLSKVYALAPQPTDRGKSRRQLKTAEEMALAQPAKLGKLASPP